ncbi:cytochrome P450 [Mycena olivaceomarginata]|nr:cytochrome P450 [Mycena olivaceomarginata]
MTLFIPSRGSLFRAIKTYTPSPDPHLPTLLLSTLGLTARLHVILYVFLSLLSQPFGLIFVALRKDYSDTALAHKWNAILPPRVDRSIGGRNIIYSIFKNFEGYFGILLTEWSRIHGPVFNIRTLFDNLIFTTQPEHVKSILSTNFSSFERGWHFRFQFHSLLGSGIFNVDAEDPPRFHRAMSRPFFTKQRISDGRSYALPSDRAMATLMDRLQRGRAVDFQDIASHYTLDWAFDFLFGTNIESLTSALPCSLASRMLSQSKSNLTEAFMEHFSAALIQTSTRTRYGSAWPLFELGGDKVERHMSVVYEYLEPIIQASLERSRHRTSDARPVDISHLTFLDYLIQHTQDKTILRDATVNMLLGGRDANTFLLSATIYALAEHPHVLSRLRAEVLEVFGTAGLPTIQELRSLKYIRAVLNETMRMWPPVPISVRKSKDAVLWAPVAPGEKPFFIPAGTNVSWSVFLIHRRKDLWGPDADKYDPDRFLDERYHKYLAPNPHIFLPFNGGPRLCLGAEVAYDQATFFLIKLLQTYSEITLAPDAQPADSLPPWQGREKLWFSCHITMYWKGGMWVRMKGDDSDS